jgi:hypothetical protein
VVWGGLRTWVRDMGKILAEELFDRLWGAFLQAVDFSTVVDAVDEREAVYQLINETESDIYYIAFNTPDIPFESAFDHLLHHFVTYTYTGDLSDEETFDDIFFEILADTCDEEGVMEDYVNCVNKVYHDVRATKLFILELPGYLKVEVIG